MASDLRATNQSAGNCCGTLPAPHLLAFFVFPKKLISFFPPFLKTQVVNGPVITSVSLLFASLVGLTISTLHSRQMAISKSLVLEVHNLRELQSLLESAAVRLSFHEADRRDALALLRVHTECLLSRYYLSPEKRRDPHAYIESTLPALLNWCNEQQLGGRKQRGKRQPVPEGSPDTPSAHELRIAMTGSKATETANTRGCLISQIYELTHRLMDERSNRWIALETVQFPTVHYLTLAVLALSIAVSYLVATAQDEVLFLEGLPIRLLWAVLVTSFTALGMVCFDLAKPFGGAYHVKEE
jgi:hypothetical protein